MEGYEYSLFLYSIIEIFERGSVLVSRGVTLPRHLVLRASRKVLFAGCGIDKCRNTRSSHDPLSPAECKFYRVTDGTLTPLHTPMIQWSVSDKCREKNSFILIHHEIYSLGKQDALDKYRVVYIYFGIKDMKKKVIVVTAVDQNGKDSHVYRSTFQAISSYLFEGRLHFLQGNRVLVIRKQ